MTPRGFALPQTKLGRWSKDLPTRLAARYHAAEADPELLSLRSELAVTDSRLGEVLASLDTREAGAIWKDLRQAARDFQRESEPSVRAAHLAAILTLIQRGAKEWQIWQEVFKTIGHRRTLAESERRRLVEAQQMVSAEQVNLLVGALVASIREHVTDRKALQGISSDLTRLLSAGPSLAA